MLKRLKFKKLSNTFKNEKRIFPLLVIFFFVLVIIEFVKDGF